MRRRTLLFTTALACVQGCAPEPLELSLAGALSQRHAFARSLIAGVSRTHRWRFDTPDSSHFRIRLDGIVDGDSNVLLRAVCQIKARQKPVVGGLLKPTDPFDCLIAVSRQGKTVLVPFAQVYGRRNYVGDGIAGQTLLPWTNKPKLGLLYSLQEQYELYVDSSLSDCEIAATIWHELAHVAHGEGHPPAIQQIEDAAHSNACR